MSDNSEAAFAVSAIPAPVAGAAGDEAVPIKPIPIATSVAKNTIRM